MIKNLFLVLALASLCGSLFAQDQIVKTNGEEIMGKVLRVNALDVIYKKKENPDGPEYSELKTNIFFVKYENGKKDNFATVIIPLDAKKDSSIGEPIKRKNAVFIEAGGNGLYASANYERKIFSSKSKNFGALKLGFGPLATIIVLNVTGTYNIGDGKNFFEFGGGVGVRTYNLFKEGYYTDNFLYFTPTLGYRRQSANGLLFRAYISTYIAGYEGIYNSGDISDNYPNRYFYVSPRYYPFVGLSFGYSF